MMLICCNCHRHFRSSEPACPFCGTQKLLAARRLGVGLAVAIGVSSTLGCGGESERSQPGTSGGNVGDNSGGMASLGGSSTNGGSGAMSGILGAYGPPPSGGASTGGRSGIGGGFGGAYAVPPSGGRWGFAGAPAYAAPPSGGTNAGGTNAGGTNAGGTNVGSATSGGASTGGMATGGRTASGGMMTAYGTPPMGGTTTGGRSGAGGGFGGAYAVPPSGGNFARGGNAGAAGAAAGAASVTGDVACKTLSGVTGWYAGDQLLCTATCSNCTVSCQAIGTKGEGWYTACASAAAVCSNSVGGLIAYADCG